MKAFLRLCILLLITPLLHGQPSKATDCNAALAKDYYSYALKNHLALDYLRTIDQETYAKMTSDNSLSLSALTPYGVFGASDDYKSFDEKRNKYLENNHYTRTQDEAVQILQLTTSDRAYKAYETCLRSVGTGGGLLVWAESENLDSIELHVKFANPPGVKGAVLTGTVDGGSVHGAPVGSLWSKQNSHWGVNTEKQFIIVAKRGVPDTRVTVQASDGSAPVTLHFKRADALLTLDYQGEVPVLREANHISAVVHSPNNDHNDGGCPNYVGRDSGKWCISRTRVSMSVAPPLFFQNPTQTCSNLGCGWGNWSRTAYLENSGTTVSADFDNHGAAVSLTVSAALWEHVDATRCGGSQGPMPVSYSQAISFAVPDECVSIATVRWLNLPTRSEGMIAFDKSGDDEHVIERKATNSAGGVTRSVFVIKH